MTRNKKAGATTTQAGASGGNAKAGKVSRVTVSAASSYAPAAKRVMVPLWGDAGAMTEVESALDDLEPSWADFAYAIRPDSMARVVRRPGVSPSIRCASLDTVHSVLEHYRELLGRGERPAIFDALTYCAEENVPMPYWLGAELIAIATQLHQKPTGKRPDSLHQLFGMEARFPTSQTKAVKAKRDLHLRGQLWHAASTLMAGDANLSKDAAIKQAREQLRFPYSQRKARDMFELQETIQRGFLDAHDPARAGSQVHRIK